MTPSVTEVLTEAGLIDTRWFNEAARDRGSRVHKVCQLYDEKDLDASSVDESIAGYLDAYKRFLKDLAPVTWPTGGIECPGTDFNGQYHGTFDRLGLVQGDIATLLDIKTGAPAPWHAIQTAAYVGLLPKAKTWRLQRMALYLSGDGTYKVIVHPLIMLPRDTAVFTAALALYQWRHYGS